MPADGAGIRFGQYVLLKRIARGGMAEVFLAQQRGLEGFDRRVAVKRILPHLADAPDFIKMFLGEARLAAQLSHPNIVHIYDFGKVDHDYFIAMEFVDGVHAGHLFKHSDKERVPPVLVARVGADAAAALHYAHELRSSNGKPLGLVHRDVSPANIMVSFDGVVKLCDFGIAKAAMLGDQLTNPGQVKGKYAYMSPEQTIAAPLDGRSDVYSLAIVMWELLSGKTIVPRGDAVEAMRAIRDGKHAPIERVAPWTPPALAKAIGWALQTKRENRATALDFAQALEAFIKSSPEIATPMQMGAWVRARFPRDHTMAVPTITPPGGGTAGTVAAPSTMAAPGTKVALITPDPDVASVIASSIMGTDTTSETIGMVPHGPNAPTVIDDGSRAAFEPTDPPFPTVVIHRPPADAEPSGGETVVLEQSRPVQTAMASPLGGMPRPPTASAPNPLPPIYDSRPVQRRADPVFTETTLGVQKRPSNRARVALAITGLVALSVLSFVIALAARGHSHASVPEDAMRVAQLPADAAIDAPPPIDAAPTIPIDASPDEPTALLEIHTNPTGATVHVGNQSRTATAQFALPAGHHVILCELDGWLPERREADLLRGEHIVQEIVFTHRVPVHPAAAMGRLSVRTTPYSEVYIGTRKLNETPFEEELAAGTYTLVFKNPEHQTVVKKITITAGKTTKLAFALP